jgi:hypothetical protein
MAIDDLTYLERKIQMIFSNYINEIVLNSLERHTQPMQIVISPYHKYYDMEKSHMIACIYTPVSFLNKLRYRINYQCSIDNAIRTLQYEWGYHSSAIVSNLAKYPGDLMNYINMGLLPPIRELTSIYFIILCEAYMQWFTHTQDSLSCQAFFLNLEKGYIQQFIRYVQLLYRDTGLATDDIVDVVINELYMSGELDI